MAPDASNAGFDKGVTLKIDTFNNYHYALTFGSQVGDLRYMKVALEAAPPPTRPPQEGESAEDKKKNDEQYLKDHAGMLAHVQREKKLEGWTFLVKDEDVKALVRDRAQLLPEPQQGEVRKHLREYVDIRVQAVGQRTDAARRVEWATRTARLQGALSARQVDFDRLIATPELPRRQPLAAIQSFADTLPYRLACTATPAPNARMKSRKGASRNSTRPATPTITSMASRMGSTSATVPQRA